MEPISRKRLHVVEQNVICHLLLLKIDNANRKFIYYRKYYVVTTFPQIQKWTTQINFSVKFFSVILLESGYSVSEITKIFGTKRGFKFDHY